MAIVSDNIRCMASLAVFRELYNDNESDIFSVIAAFAKNIIIKEKIYQFELQDFCLKLNNEYGFTLVSPVVKTALNKIQFLSSKKTTYIVDATGLSNGSKFQQEFKECQDENDKILNDFISYVTDILKRQIPEEEIKSLKEDFCAYTLDHKVGNSENLGYISAFILNHGDNKEFQSQLTRIREGMIIYNGLSYTLSPNEVERYDTELNIFLETEVLFNMAGYNGVLCQYLFNEFYRQVNDINKVAINKNGKKVIHLKYFEESFNEIQKFFKQAEDIICGKSKLVDPRSAMVCLVDGCSQKYEIKEKCTAFEKMLAEKDIILDNRKYDTDSDNFIKCNLASIEYLNEVLVNKEDKDYAIQMMLSKINYLRHIKATNSKNFKQVGYILLSGNSRTLTLGKRSNDETVPLAEPISFFTQRFWLSLNKGLLNGNLPVNANILTLSQITFSHVFNKALDKQFSLIKNKIDSGELSLDEAKEKIAGFRVSYTKPEDINKDIVGSYDYLDIFNAQSVEHIQAERALEISELKESLNQESSNRKVSDRRLQNSIDKQNASFAEQYKYDMKEYNDEKHKWIKKKQLLKYCLSMSLVLFYFCFVGVLLCVIIKYQSLWAILVEVVSVVFFGLGFVIDKLKWHIQFSFQYICSRKKRNEYINNLELEYTKTHQLPIKKIVSAEDFD